MNQEFDKDKTEKGFEESGREGYRKPAFNREYSSEGRPQRPRTRIVRPQYGSDVRATVITMREVSVRKVSALLSMTMPSRVSAVRMDSVHVSTGAMAAAAIITEMAIIVAAMASRTATITSRGATVQDITTIMKGK